MIELFFKLILPPLMIGVATLASHRWGPTVGGVLAAVPAKGGPIMLFLALDQGAAFAATSSVAALCGVGGCAFFCLVYARVCRRVSWPIAGAAAYAAFVGCWLVIFPLSSLGLAVVFAATVGLCWSARRLMPEAPPVPRRAASARGIPARMVAGVAMLLFVTTVGPYFGATISGMMAAVPTVAAVLALFTHTQEGPDRTIGVMRGMTHGLLGLAAFLAVVAATVVSLGIWVSFALASSTVVVVQLIELRAALRAHAALPEEIAAVPEAAE
jgi:hypothetical protein